jgi:hypothetical protein
MMREEEKEEERPYETAPEAPSIVPGDVENGAARLKKTPPPPPQQQQQRISPAPSGGRAGPKPEQNADFDDVENTGHWGSISRKDMIIIAVVLLCIIGGVVAAVVVLTTRSNNSNTSPALAPKPPDPTPAPTSPPEIDPELQLPVILEAVEANVFGNASLLPNNVTLYNGLANDTSQLPIVRAMSWSLYDDPLDPAPDNPWLVLRFALATIYYAMGGEQWTNQDNWLSMAPVCDWNGIYCDRFGNIVNEIDLGQNNLIGTIPSELNMLSDLIGLTLTTNKLTGTVPWLALGSLPSLSLLFLDDNQLTGTLSADARANGVLSKLYFARHAHHVSIFAVLCSNVLYSPLIYLSYT